MGLAMVALVASVVVAESEKGSAPFVVRLGVELVQIDAVVTDKEGRPVTDLVAADFEVRQDGRRQTVTHVAYIGGPARPGVADRARSPATAEGPSPGESGEALVFVVDDLALSLNSVAATTGALLRFADGMDPEMQVFLLRTGQGAVDLRPIEGPAELRATARSLRYNPLENAYVMGRPAFDRQVGATSLYLSGLQARQSLLSLQSIIDALRGWKGRKTLVLFSDGFPIWNLRGPGVLVPLDQVYGPGEDVLDAVERLTDLANRASAVIHTVDPRGLVTTGISAADSLPDFGHEVALNLQETRRTALLTSQASLAYIAEQTGGLAVADSNDVSGGVARILSGSHSYYLVGYTPERATFRREGLRFHRLEVKVKRRGLKVRTRKGFFGISDEAVAAMAPPPVVP